MKNTILTFILMISIPLSAFSQKSITGYISDTNGEPITGATVQVKNTSKGTITDIEGRFTVTAKVTDVIVISFIGYIPQEIMVQNEKPINIILQEDVKQLEGIVVIGYGEQSRKDFTGSLTELDMKDVVKAPVASFDQALAGRIAGVQVNTNDAQPGQEMNIVIRGSNSLTQNNSPLYVVDGFPLEDFSAASLNPSDIASFNVLKDASATAIYGSRGANGVIIIETKKGKIGKPVITYDGAFGFQTVSNTMDLMNPYDFVRYQIERDPSKIEYYLTEPNLTLSDYQSYPNIDWQDRLFQNAPLFIQNLSISGGSDKNRYSASVSLVDQQGVVINSGFKKYQGRIRLDQNLSKKFKIGFTMNYTNDSNYGQVASSQGNSSSAYATYLMYRTWGYRPVNIGSDDIFNDLFDSEDESAIMNPIISSKNEIREQNRNTFNSNITLDYQIHPSLKLMIRGGVNYRTITDETFNNSKTYRGYNSPNNTKGINGSFTSDEKFNWMNENTLTYKHSFNKRNIVDVTVGATLEGSQRKIYGYDVINIPNESLGLAGMGQGTPSSISSTITQSTLLSGFARINYNLNSRYLFTGTIRADGSSKFAPQNRWGYFPSGAFAWRMDQEKFMKQISWIDESKMRVSYGLTGNNRIGDFDRYQNLAIGDYYSFGNGIPDYALTISSLGNPDLKWETTAQFDFGLDFSFFKERLGITFDLYEKTTSDLLLKAKMPATSGVSSMYKNVGKIRNRGLELTISTVNIATNNFRWESDLNVSFNKSKVLELADDQLNLLSTISWTGDWNGAYLYLTEVGGPVTQFFGYKWLGNYQYEDFDKLADGTYILKANVADNGSPREQIKPGDIKYQDQNNDGTVNDKDRISLGDPMPIATGGFNNNFMYKGFKLNLFFQYSIGNKVMNANRIIFEGNPTNRMINQFSSYNNRWTTENQTNENYRVGGQGPRGVYSSKTIEDASFLRLKTIQLSYMFPQKWIQKIKLQHCEVYVSAQNLFTWTAYSGMDPEVSVKNTTLTPGFDYSAYPQSIAFTGGFRVSF